MTLRTLRTLRTRIASAVVAGGLAAGGLVGVASAATIVVPRSTVSTRHAFHGRSTAPEGYYWVTFRAKRAYDFHFYADCSDSSDDGHGFGQVATNLGFDSGPQTDNEFYDARKAVFMVQMRAGRSTMIILTTCKWGLSVPNRVRFTVARHG